MITAAGLTDIGCKRSQNQDRILLRPDEGLFAVADGMGGERCGERAAELATSALDEYFQSVASEWLPLNGRERHETLQTTQIRMATAIRLANERVFTESFNGQDCRGMGCTVSAVTITGGMATVGSVGDTRVYLFRNKQLLQLTRDDSVVAKLLESGAITDEQTRSHPMRNLLTQSVGTKESVDVQIAEFALASGDRLLVCSDGLHAVSDDTEMRNVLASGIDADEAARALISAARDQGGPDNISCIVIDYRS